MPDEQVGEDTCQKCRERIEGSAVSAKSTPTGKKNWLIALTIAGVAGIAAVGLTVMMGSGRCESRGCQNKAVKGSHYCYSHKCVLSSCPEEQYALSNYCYSHYLRYDDDAKTKTESVHSWQLAISNVSLSSNSSYTIVEGKITNNSNSTVRFVKVKGAFQNSAGRVVDTDWTYAVGSEGLAPGESCKWRMSVSKDYSIQKCDVTILDYDS